MFQVIVIVAIIAAILLGLIVLIQNPKGGGLSGTFGGAANQIFGYKRSTNDVEKFTWILVIAVFVLCLGSAAVTQSDADGTTNTLGPEAKQPTTTTPMPQPSPGNSEPLIDNNSGDVEAFPPPTESE
jgi:preprotein translocase subunit SecG